MDRGAPLGAQLERGRAWVSGPSLKPPAQAPTKFRQLEESVQSALKKSAMTALTSLALAASTSPAAARNQTPDEGDAPSLPSLQTPEPAPDDPGALEQQLAEMRQRLARAEDAQRNTHSPLQIGGYADLGFFAPRGNGGAGWVRDAGNQQFPQYSGYAWTFLGEILATAINTRGEVADLGEAPGVDRFDSVNSNGAPGFLVNELNLRVGYTLSDAAVLRTSVNFMPRSGQDFSLGDFMEVDLAELEYVLTDDGNTSLFVGKSLPSFGIEYKERKSDQRFGITPSLVHRYTSGPQLGVKLRSKLLSRVADPGRLADQRLVGDRAVPLLLRGRQQQRQDSQRPGRPQHSGG